MTYTEKIMNTKILLAAMSVAAVFAGCGKNDEVLPSVGKDAVELEVRINGAQTKVEGTEDENKVHNVQIFIFDHNGMLEAYASGDGSQPTVSLSCSTGQKEIIALVNAKPHGDVRSLTDLEGRRTDLSDNRTDSFVMEGRLPMSITENTSTQIDVFRIAARVTLSEIAVDFGLEQHNGQTFQIKSVYLVNVAGDRTFLQPTQPGQWYNRMMKENDAPSLTGVALLDAFASVSKPYTDDVVLYCYPNPVAADVCGGMWSPRLTRLVVEAELGGKNYYYPVTLKDGVTSNMTYDVRMKITRPGSSSPDKPVDSVNAGFTVEVQPWGGVSEVEETI